MTTGPLTRGPTMLGVTLWLGSWLRATVPPDDLWAALAALAPDRPAVVARGDAGDGPLVDLAAALRRGRADRCWLLLPRPGRTVGWPAGSPDVPEPATLVTGTRSDAWLLRSSPTGWRVDHVAGSGTAPLEARALAPRPAGRELLEVLSGAADRFESLGLDRPHEGPRPARWSAALHRLPPDLDPEAVAVLQRIAEVRDALDVALSYDGAAVTAAEVRERSAALHCTAGDLDDLLVAVVAGIACAPAR